VRADVDINALGCEEHEPVNHGLGS
jgi:hypothetical protein